MLVYYSSSSSSGEKAHKKDYLHKFGVSFSSCFLYLLQISSCCCKTCRTSNKNSPCIPTRVVVFTVDIAATFLCVCVCYIVIFFSSLFFIKINGNKPRCLCYLWQFHDLICMLCCLYYHRIMRQICTKDELYLKIF